MIPGITERTVIGVVTRLDGRGSIFVYFFALEPATDVNDQLINTLLPDVAVWRSMCGDLGLLKGEWRVMGEVPNWDRNAWPLPPFVQLDSISNERFEVHYDDELNYVLHRPLQPGTGTDWPTDSLSGYKAAEIHIRQQLGLPVVKLSSSVDALPESSRKVDEYCRAQPAVLVFLRGPLCPEDVYALEDRLIATIEKSGCGKLDGTQIGPLGGDDAESHSAQIFMSGPDAERLHSAIEGVLRSSPLCRGARVLIRQRPLGSKSREYLLPL